jgi:hypothetical protein
MPGKPFRSKLLPHAEFIREAREQGRGYREIAAELHSRFGLTTAPANIFSFVKVRACRRPVFALPPRHAPVATPANVASPAPSRLAPNPAPTANWHFYDPNKPLEKLPLQP